MRCATQPGCVPAETRVKLLLTCGSTHVREHSWQPRRSLPQTRNQSSTQEKSKGDILTQGVLGQLRFLWGDFAPGAICQGLEIFLAFTDRGGGATSIQWREGKGAGKHPAGHRTAPLHPHSAGLFCPKCRPSLLRLLAEIKCNGSAALRLRKLAARSHECAATAACIGTAAGEGPAAEHGTRAI